MAYLIDANVFMSAKNFHYGLDFCPAFWEWLVKKNEAQLVFSIEKVGDEIQAGNDELSAWAAQRGRGFFLRPDAPVLPSLAIVSNWANSQQYVPAAINTYLQGADYYIVAQAHSSQYTVVTHEIPANTVNKIKIPNVCIGLGVKCMTPYEMLRVERARFILGPRP